MAEKPDTTDSTNIVTPYPPPDLAEKEKMAEKPDTTDSTNIATPYPPYPPPDLAEKEKMAGKPDMTYSTNIVTPYPPYPPPGQAATVLPPPMPFIPGQGMPIEAAPVQWVPATSTIPECPPGLEYLTQIDQLLIHPTQWTFTRYQYQIKDVSGQQVYFAFEESQLVSSQDCSFEMHVTNNNRQEVMKIVGPVGYRCHGCCVVESLCNVAVESPAEQVIGRFTVGSNAIFIHDADSKPVMSYKPPYIKVVSAHPDREYPLITCDGSKVIGKVIEQWSGISRASKFKIEFPVDLHVKIKATILASVFLMNVRFTEDNDRRQ